MEDARGISEELAAVEEACDILSRRERPSFGDVTDVSPDLDRASKGGTLLPSSLLNIARLAVTGNQVRGFLWRRRDHYPALTARYGSLERVEDIAPSVRRILDDTGRIRDDASPVIAELRGSMLRIRESIIASIKEFMAAPLTAEMLQDAYYTIRNGRYVLPIKVNFKNQIKGIIHGASQTGATLFIEPDGLIEPGNELMICESRIEEETERLLAELTAMVAASAGVLGGNLVTLRALDVLFAKAEFSSILAASAPAPGGAPALRDARHPLLALRGVDVVPNDLVFPEGCRGMLISGPNAGGKTVLLKTVGLLSLMTAAGMPIPVSRGSKIPLFSGIFTVFGDAQDLGGDLSSFSGHIVQLKMITEEAGPGSLVLLDEIASDTDPREGAALAASIIEEIIDRGAFVMATSHFHELREWASGRAGMVNAGVGFDMLKLRPSFKLKIGQTGESFALKIAANLGLPGKIIDRARALMGRVYAEVERLLDSLKKQEEDLKSALEAAGTERAAERAAFEKAGAEFETEAKAARDTMEAERLKLVSELSAVREQAAARIAALQNSTDMKTAVDTRQWLSEVMNSVERVKAPSRPPFRTPSPGDRVEVTTLGLSGTVERMDFERKTAVVIAAGKRISAPISAVRLSESSPPSAAAAAKAPGLLEAIEAGKKPAAPQDELDLRGMFHEEAVSALERFLDASFRDSMDAVRIIHGHGTGALKRAVRTHLSISPYVASFRPGAQNEGGDGATMALLKKD
jgi:DNA mismatch repair protein MutS2